MKQLSAIAEDIRIRLEVIRFRISNRLAQRRYERMTDEQQQMAREDEFLALYGWDDDDVIPA